MSEQCLIFEQVIASSPRALDWVSFLGTRAFPCSHHRFTPFALQLGVTGSAGDLALTGMQSTNMFLESEILFGSPGMGSGTRSSWLEVGAMIPLPHVLQVSICLDTIYFYSTDIDEQIRVHPGLFCAVSDPLNPGGEDCDFRNYTRSRCAVVSWFGVSN